MRKLGENANGPNDGYRYDGLYDVERYERVRSKRGLYICRFHLVSQCSRDDLETRLQHTLKPSYGRSNSGLTLANQIQRNVGASQEVKALYAHQCQVCRVLLQSPNGPIAAASHIRPLYRPHLGPDTKENILCLCPNHHNQWHSLSFYIEPETLEIVGLKDIRGQSLHVHAKHQLCKTCLAYHKKNYLTAQ